MNSQHLSSFFLLFAVRFLVLVEAFQSDGKEFYKECGNRFSCGSTTNIGYPFRGIDDPFYCGYPGLALKCQPKGVIAIEIMNATYYVLEINESKQTMRVVREDVMRATCPKDIVNTTLDYSLFDYSLPNTNLTFLYGCPTDLPGVNLACGNGYNAVYVLPGSQGPGKCEASVVVPILVTTGDGYGDGQIMSSTSWDQVLRRGFEIRWKIDSKDCNDCLESKGRCGFDFGTNKTACFCPDKPYISQTCTEASGARSSSGKGDSNKVGMNVGLSIAGAVVAGIGLGWLIFFCRNKKKQKRAAQSLSAESVRKDLVLPSSNKSSSTPSTGFTGSIPSYPSSKSEFRGTSSYFGVQVFSYEELEDATNNFDPSRELGDGGFGTVYYGVLTDGRVVAVKRLYEHNFKREEQFMNEVQILTRLRHKNLVALYGCTSKRSRQLLLVYEYIPNGTVADHLHGKRANSGLLSWTVRLNIAIESAEALAYLHKSDIIHRDVKTTNILLDNDFHVKVADFGLSKLFPDNVTHVSTAPQGTPGYVDPEYYRVYQLTEKSDVYSFGVVLIELISSLQAVDTNRHRHDINLANMAVNKIQNHTLHELVDSSLGFETNSVVRRMATLVAELAFRCLQQERDMRPSMDEVLEALKRIRDGDLNAQKVDVVDILIDDEVGLLKGSVAPSPPESDGTDKSPSQTA